MCIREQPWSGIGVRLMDIGVREMRLLNDFIEHELKGA